MLTGDRLSSGWLGVLLAAEAALLLCLLLLAAWPFSQWASSATTGAATLARSVPAYDTSDLMLGVFVCAVIYGLLQLLGRSNLAFWLAALLVLLPQAPGIWWHNSLQWQRFIGPAFQGNGAQADGGQPLIITTGLFLVCLAGLAVLHRAIALRKLGRLLTLRGVDGKARDQALLNETAVLIGVIVAGLALALLLTLAGSALGRPGWLSDKTPWEIITIGGTASLLLIGFAVLYLRSIGQGRG